MIDTEFLVRVLLETLTLFFMLVGLVGSLIPIFPGLTVIWLATLFYAIMQALNAGMNGFDWFLFAVITILMLVGNVADNIIIAGKVRERKVPWSSIILGFLAGIIASIFFTPLAGLVAAPVGLFGAEYLRLRDRKEAWNSTRGWMSGWGVSIAVRIVIGLIMIGFWMLWAWV